MKISIDNVVKQLPGFIDKREEKILEIVQDCMNGFANEDREKICNLFLKILIANAPDLETRQTLVTNASTKPLQEKKKNFLKCCTNFLKDPKITIISSVIKKHEKEIPISVKKHEKEILDIAQKCIEKSDTKTQKQVCDLLLKILIANTDLKTRQEFVNSHDR